MPYLAFNLNDGNEFVFDILEERLSIGRDAKNDIVIDNTYISGFHAEFIRQTDGGYELVDLKSSNGTFINGKRIEKGRVKGGDKIRFGQLDSRFRERPPKGTAPASEVKPPAPGKGQPVRTDGRRGDTESVPARDAGAKSETSPIEPTRVPLARPDNTGKGPASVPLQSTPIQRPSTLDPALQKQAEELQEAVAKLKQERDVLRAENEKEARRRDEVRTLEKQIEEHRKTVTETEAKLAALKTTLSASEVDVSKLDGKRREAGNLDSQLESTRSELAKVQADIAVASKSLQSIHADADKVNADRSSHLKEKESLTADLATLRKQISEAESKAKGVEQEVHTTDTQLGSANEALKAVETHKAELAAAIAKMTQERDTLTREHLAAMEKGKAQHSLTQTLTGRRETLEKELQEAETQKESLSLELGKIRETLRQAETALTERQEEIKNAEEKAKTLTTQTAESERQREDLQKEIESLRDQSLAAKTGLEQITQDTAAKKEAAEAAAATEKKYNAQSLELQGKISGLEAMLATLTSSQADRQLQSGELETAHRGLSDQLTARRQEVSVAEVKLGELKTQIAAQESRLVELSAQEKKLTDARAELASTKQEIEKNQTELKRLKEEQSGCETRLPGLRNEAEKLQSEVATKLKDLADGESRLTTITQKVSELETRAKEQTALQSKLEETRTAFTSAKGEHEKLAAILLPLTQQREEHEKELPKLKSELETLRSELGLLMRDKQSTAAALEKAQADRKSAMDQTEALRTESSNLEKLLHDKRNTLEAETKSKLAEATAAEARLKELQTQIETSEKRTAELADREQRLSTATQGVKEAEKQRLIEEKSLAELAKQQESLRKDISKFTADIQLASAQITELTKKAKVEEARVADAEARLQKATVAHQTTEAKRLETEAQMAKTREEDKTLRKQIPAMNTELAGLQAMLVSLTKEREEASQFVTRLNVATENNNRKLGDLQQQISQLEEAHKVREERLMKAQEEVDKETARLKAAQESTRQAELTLQDLEKEVKESRQKADAARTQSTGLETELSTRLDRIEKLKLEETRLLKEVETQQLEVQGVRATVAELQDKLRHEEGRLGEFTQVGGKILSLGAALAGLETRHSESGKTLREAAERELSLQVKINALQESLNRESARVEQVKKERASLEAELGSFAQESEKQIAILKAQEMEQRKRLADFESQLRDHVATSERLKAELTDLNDRRAEFTQAEAQLHHWKEIEARLRGQLLELEEKHEIMRRGLATEESTVIMFANDIIKRIDLIDALSSRYAGHSGGDVVAQLRTLRHSFEDILLQHGISEFDISAGTEVDVDLRKRITVVESVPGKNKPRVVETCRSGFIYSREDGHELVLRKVEVRTSSQ